MKKLFIIFPLLVLASTGCSKQSAKKKTTSGVLSSSSEQITSEAPSKTSIKTTTAVPRPGEYRFKQKEGDWEVFIDLENYYLDYKKEFPYVSADSGIQIFEFANLSVKANGCYVSSYNAKGFIYMKNTGGYASASGVSFLASDDPLYHIEKVEITSSSNVDKNANYNIYIGDEPIYRTGGCTTGTDVGTAGAVTGDGSYFCITQTNANVDGKLKSIYVKYHYEIPEPEPDPEEEKDNIEDKNSVE